MKYICYLGNNEALMTSPPCLLILTLLLLAWLWLLAPCPGIDVAGVGSSAVQCSGKLVQDQKPVPGTSLLCAACVHARTEHSKGKVTTRPATSPPPPSAHSWHRTSHQSSPHMWECPPRSSSPPSPSSWSRSRPWCPGAAASRITWTPLSHPFRTSTRPSSRRRWPSHTRDWILRFWRKDKQGSENC